MPTHKPLSVVTTFCDLSAEPLTADQLKTLRQHFADVCSQSRRYKRRVTLMMAVIGALVLFAMSKDAYQSMMWIDWILLAYALFGVGFLAWGFLDDRLFAQRPVSIRVDGVEYARLVHESMRKRTSLLDPDRIDDIYIPKDAVDVHRFTHAILHKEQRSFTGLDRMIILSRV